jgi:Coenzyme PQQ synthesis protein D (PqqD)
MERTPDRDIFQRRVTVPKHVVFRDFVSETVLLNIETGQYHGLNPVAGRMLSVLDSVGSVEEAARRLAAEFEQPLDRIETDLAELCEGLLERRLLEFAAP